MALRAIVRMGAYIEFSGRSKGLRLSGVPTTIAGKITTESLPQDYRKQTARQCSYFHSIRTVQNELAGPEIINGPEKSTLAVASNIMQGLSRPARIFLLSWT